MAKKLSLLFAAVAVLAFAIPSMASAAEATVPAGTRAPVGTLITGTGKNVILTSSTLGEIKCATLELKGEITKNDGTTVEGSGNNTKPTQTGCENGPGRPVTVASVNLTKLFANGTATGKTTVKPATVSFTAEVLL